jgi:hypothetical protein
MIVPTVVTQGVCGAIRCLKGELTREDPDVIIDRLPPFPLAQTDRRTWQDLSKFQEVKK